MNPDPEIKNGNLIVVAGAGTGKTYRLVQTCLARLREGVGIDEILVVTFTKAAAAELRHRIAQALQQAFAADPGSAHLARQIALLDRAQISTLHSFCLELVSRHFSDLGLSPRLMTLEAAQAAALQSETLDSLFESYYEAKSPSVQARRQLLLDRFHGDDRAVREAVVQLHEFTQTRPGPDRWLAARRADLLADDPQLWRESLPREIAQWVRRWRPAIEAQDPSPKKNPARALVLAAMDQNDVSAIAHIGASDDPLVWPRGSKQHWRNPFKNFSARAAALAGWLKTPDHDPLLEDWNLTREASLLLLEITQEFGGEFARLKRGRGLVDFHDLEQFSLQLLWDPKRNAPTPRAEFWQRRFQWIFVDEYQDINLAQDRILTALSRPGPGNRFLVGDVKQSIYGFRHAEPRIFLDYEAKWAGAGCDYLLRNWRSCEPILTFVNALFRRLMTGEVGGVIYDDKASLQFADTPARASLSTKADPSPKVEVHMLASAAEKPEDLDDPDDRDEPAPEAPNPLAEMDKIEAEAEILARRFQQMVESEPLMLPTGRPVGYGDIVILMRSAAGAVEAFAKVFSRRGIPFDARRSGFFNCVEILDLTNLLTILDNPLQDIPLLGVLRSPLGCFSIESLAEVRLAQPRGPFWQALISCASSASPAAAPSRQFLNRFNQWRALSRHTSLAQRLEIILEETGYEDWAAAQDRGPQRRANVRRLIDLARQFDELRGEGLYPFLQFVADQSASVGEIIPAPPDSQGAVRLMSVHQSKGLQFPVVAIAGLGKRFNLSDFKRLALLDDQFGVCLKARPPGKRVQYETLPFWAARLRGERRVLDEEMRILYVALTRAEHRLLLVATPAKKARESWAEGNAKPLAEANSLLDWIGPFLARDDSRWLEQPTGVANAWTWQWHESLPPSAQALPALSRDVTPSPGDLLALRARLEWSYPFAADTVQEAKSSATALRRGLVDEPELARPISTSKRKQPPGSLRANELGQAIHRLLQLARFPSFSGAEALRLEIAHLVETGSLGAAEAEAIEPAKILRFWSGDFGRELLARQSSIRRELTFTARFTRADLMAVGAPLAAEFGGEEFVVVQGAADLVAILPDELWLVDFKTDRLPDELMAARVQEYSLQLRIYALALSRIYRKPVTRSFLFFLETGRLISS